MSTDTKLNKAQRREARKAAAAQATATAEVKADEQASDGEGNGAAQQAAAADPAPVKAPRRVVLKDRAGHVAVFRHLDAWTKTTTANGNNSADNGDAAALLLRGLTLDEAYARVAALLAVEESALRARYAGLNAGQVRMNLGNKARGFYTRKAKAAQATNAT